MSQVDTDLLQAASRSPAKRKASTSIQPTSPPKLSRQAVNMDEARVEREAITSTQQEVRRNLSDVFGSDEDESNEANDVFPAEDLAEAVRRSLMEPDREAMEIAEKEEMAEAVRRSEMETNREEMETNATLSLSKVLY